jgi:hypothetical protein
LQNPFLKLLKTVVFGTPTAIINEDWKSQCFKLCDYPKLKYGLVQNERGPCGVFASVQAYFLIETLFVNDPSNPSVSS